MISRANDNKAVRWLLQRAKRIYCLFKAYCRLLLQQQQRKNGLQPVGYTLAWLIFAAQLYMSMLIKTSGIVFRTMKYGETSLIVDIYTEQKGMRSYIIGGVRKARPTVGASLLQILSLVDIVAYHREDKSLTRLKEIRPLYTYQSVPYDIRKSAVGMFIVEVARKVIKGHEAHPELFAYVRDTLLLLDESDKFTNLHLHFMVGLCAYLGFLPEEHFDESQPWFDLQAGTFCPAAPAHEYYLEPEEAAILNALLSSTMKEAGDIPMSLSLRRKMLNKLITYYRLHIEDFPAIHSHQVLEEVLG